jgi:hypothetical protein
MSTSARTIVSTKSILSFALLLAFSACGGSDGDVSGAGGAGPHGSGGTAGLGAAGQDSTGAAGGDTTGNPGTLGTPTQLTSGSASMVGMTSDDWVLYRLGDELYAQELGGDGDAELVAEQAGNTLVRGKVVFNFANVDWTANVGDLSIWTHAGGAQEIGSTQYSESLISASASGDFLVYTANTNTKKGKTELMLASADFSVNDVLIPELGLGSDTTCSPSLGFVGERLFVGFCAPGSRDATIERFDFDGQAWNPTVIAEQVLPAWSADETGDGIFYQTDNYEGYYAKDGEASRIDASVSRGFLLPDGSAVLYTVGDQLRRSPVPDADPEPIVTTGFAEPVAFTSSYGMALYSSKVTYDNGTQRDLRLVATDGFNPEPIELVDEPVAAMPRSSLTKDGNFVLFLTDVAPTGGTLHVVGMDGGEVLSLPGVLDVLAAHGSSIVFTDNASDPDVYPNVADLEYIDVASMSEPVLVEGAVLDAKNFQLDARGERVIYLRSGVDRDTDDPEHDGVFACDLP